MQPWSIKSSAQLTCWECILAGSISCGCKQPDDCRSLAANQLGSTVQADVSNNAALPGRAGDALVQQQKNTAQQSYHALLMPYILMLLRPGH